MVHEDTMMMAIHAEKEGSAGVSSTQYTIQLLPVLLHHSLRLLVLHLVLQ